MSHIIEIETNFYLLKFYFGYSLVFDSLKKNLWKISMLFGEHTSTKFIKPFVHIRKAVDSVVSSQYY